MRSVSIIIGCLVLGLVFLFATNAPHSAKPTSGACSDCNIILISVDSLRADHMSAYGYGRDTTPQFDAFAKRGALFLNYFSTSFLTPVAESSVATGLYPTENGISNFDTELPSDRATLAEYLSAHGYATAALISSPEFVGNPALAKSFARGFRTYDNNPPDPKAPGVSRNYPTTEKLESFLDANVKGPSFLWLALGGVHWPYGAGNPATYEDEAYAGPLKGATLDWTVFQNLYKGIRYPDGTMLTDADTAYVRARYDDDVRAFDIFFALLVKELDARGMLENTVIVVESEHGEDLGEHGYFAHYDVLDTQTHVPLLIYMPGRAGTRVDGFASGVDIFPTVSDILGLGSPENVSGKSLLPAMEGTATSSDAVFLERIPLWEEAHKGLRADLEARGIRVVSGQYRDIAIRTKRFKYILRLAREREEQVSWWAHLTGMPVTVPEAELYDLSRDPGETKNVIADFPDEAKELRTRLETWYAKIRANAPSHIQQDEQVQPYF